MQLALTDPCVSYLMKPVRLIRTVCQSSYPRLMSMQLALTDPCVSYLMKPARLIRTVCQSSYPRLMSVQLALTVPCVSYLMKTGETNQDSLSKARTLGSCPCSLHSQFPV